MINEELQWFPPQMTNTTCERRMNSTDRCSRSKQVVLIQFILRVSNHGKDEKPSTIKSQMRPESDKKELIRFRGDRNCWEEETRSVSLRRIIKDRVIYLRICNFVIQFQMLHIVKQFLFYSFLYNFCFFSIVQTSGSQPILDHHATFWYF